jgi:RHS repeat-associated protein
MTYDHTGNRVKYQVATTTTYYPNQYFDQTATTTKDRHIYANNMLVASMRAIGTATSTFYAHTDHLGGSTIITDSSGNLNELNDYYPFGEVRLDQQQTSYKESKKYIGGEYDSESSLSYLINRYLNGKTGKFLSEDPVFNGSPLDQNLKDPQSLNSYSYANNNPISKKDPDGRAAGAATISGGLSGILAGLSAALTSLQALIASNPGLLVGVGAATLTVGGYQGVKWALADPLVNLTTPATLNSSRFTPKTKVEAKDMADGNCVYCGQPTVSAEKSEKGVPPPGNQGETDHYIPKSKGGSNTPSNAEHACRTCNQEKSDTMPKGTKWELPRRAMPDL